MYDAMPLRLPDGRTLGYAEFGDPAGRPFVCALGLTSRRFYPFDDSIAAGLGLRLILIDRPGLGLSDPQPGRRLLDWPADVAALADALGLGRLGLLGAHAGAPYAAACAVVLAERVAVLGLVSAPAPAGRPVYSAGQRLAAWGRRSLARVQQALHRQPPLTHAWISQNPVKAWQRFHHALPDVDREIVRLYGPRYLKPAWMRDHIDELYRQGVAGAEQDDALLAEPWGFEPADIRAPVRLWHGEADPEAPLAAGQFLAARLPGCEAHFLPGAGHWFYLAHWAEILSELAASI